MQKYNLALLPEADDIQSLFCEYAGNLFSRNADEYLLGKGSLAHITLTQFMAASDEAAMRAFDRFNMGQTITACPTELYLRHVEWRGDKRVWIELLFAPNPALIVAQQEAWTAVTETSLNAIHHPSTYKPHLSLARVNEGLEVLPDCNTLPIGKTIPFKPTLGLSSIRGMFIRKIAP